MIWLKAWHVIFMVTWFAGLFYLPRLFVYHAKATDAEGVARFKVMERRLFILMTLGAALTAVFGSWMIALDPLYFLSLGWLRTKLVLVALLFAYHAYSFRLLRDFACDRNRHSARWYRYYNEVPSALLIAIVLLAIVKP
jgi:protoporphyrinogen IX oxidase